MNTEMKASALRQKYLDFFTGKGHSVIKSAPLVPENDPTVLFTTAGMHPLVPYLLGERHPHGKRLVNFQKCIRTGDIDEVGDAVHLTFFEMLGNWSLGDYFKKEAIEFSFEFLTDPRWLGLPLDRLAVSVFAGDNDAPFDVEAFQIWKSLGLTDPRIAKLPKKDNWWGPAGQTGPCGPDTEMFYWVGSEKAPADFNNADPRWVEIWNDVFMQYNKDDSGGFAPLVQKNVDTGMGVERVTAIMQGRTSCYETELFTPIIEVLNDLRKCSGAENSGNPRSDRIIADHMRASVFIMADGISPGNVDQAYVLRRLIRRSVREAKKTGIKNFFTHIMAESVIENFKDVYPELDKSRALIIDGLKREEELFDRTLEKGLREFEKFIAKIPEHVTRKTISGRNAFYLYETYGFPIELTEELAGEKGFSIDKKGFDEAYRKHQELSRIGAEQKFKGGLADSTDATAALHTATHLLHNALRRILGSHVAQKGSNINAERLRFDFSHPDKMTPEQIKAVEDLVNEQIARKLPVICEEMTVDEALAKGAIGLFTDRYGEKVKVYSIGDFSTEICGGPHIGGTDRLGSFRIIKEESSSQGIRRIKAILQDK